MNQLNSNFIGIITLLAGISALLQVILLILMFTVSRNPFGRISDYFYALTPLLILPLFLAFQRIPGLHNSQISMAVMLIGILGILIASIAQVVLLLKVINFKQSVWGNSIGMGLISIPILTLAFGNLGNSQLPAGFNWFGLILGVAMLIGIPAVIFFIDELHALGSGANFNWKTANPLVYVTVLAGILSQIGLPVWLVWAARLILSGNLAFSI